MRVKRRRGFSVEVKRIERPEARNTLSCKYVELLFAIPLPRVLLATVYVLRATVLMDPQVGRRQLVTVLSSYSKGMSIRAYAAVQVAVASIPHAEPRRFPRRMAAGTPTRVSRCGCSGGWWIGRVQIPNQLLLLLQAMRASPSSLRLQQVPQIL
jgi:hypothetical protein